MELVGADFCLLLDASNTVIGGTLQSMPLGRTLDLGGYVAEFGGHIHMSASAKIVAGETVIGKVVIGHRVEVGFANDIKKLTGSDALIVWRGGIVAQSRVVAEGGLSPIPTATTLADLVAAERVRSAEVQFVGQKRLVTVVALAEDVHLVLSRPLSLFLGMHSGLLWLILGGGLCAGVMALLVARWTAKRISQPIRELTLVSQELARGNFSVKVKRAGSQETRVLGDSFVKLASRIVELIEDVRQHAQVAAEQKAALEIADAHEGREKAEAASIAKSEFLANMSHELRTPMHAILSFASFGTSKWEKAERSKIRRYFQQIRSSAENLLQLLNELLDLSKLEAGHAQLNLNPADLRGLINTVVDEFHSLLESKGQRVTFSEDTEMRLALDSGRIMQVVRNLIGNATKFSPEGVEILITAEQTPDWVRVQVSDRGVGIPEDEMEKIFDKFSQSSLTKTGAGGTGLGLAICQDILQLHKGRIWAENRAGGGSVFTFELPIRDPSISVAQLTTADS